MSGVKKDMLLKVYSPKERGGSWAALGRLWAGFAGFLAVMCLLGLQGKGQLKMYVVPGGQIPRREQTVGRTTALQCCGGEHELFLRGFFKGSVRPFKGPCTLKGLIRPFKGPYKAL